MSDESTISFLERKLRNLIGQSESQGKRRPLPIPSRIVFGLLLLIVAGTALLMTPWVTVGRPLTLGEALFTATSALTVTGLTIISAGHDLTLLGQLILLGLIQIGGVGYMFAAVLMMRLVGRHVPLIDRLALSSSLGLNTPAAILKIFKRSFYGILMIEGMGALLLYWHWQANGVVASEDTFFYALFHAISAFCNAGFDLFSGLADYPDGIPKDNASLIIKGVLIILGGLGIPVLSELFTLNWRRRLTLHTRVTLIVVAALTVAGWLGLFVPEARAGGVLENAPLGEQLLHTLFQSISTRTAGFAGITNFPEVRPESQLLMMGLMFIGSAPASMGGGITTGTFAVLLLALWGYARGFPTARVAGRRLTIGTVRRAGAVLTVSLALVFLATWLILLTHDLPLSAILFEVISAFATCGLSLGITPDLNLFGQLIILITMIWGRLGALTIVLAIAHQRTHDRLVEYPEESILIG